MEKEYDVFGIGNVLVDYIADVEESTLKELKLNKNVMNKKKIKFIRSLESKIGGIKKYSGGTVPNVIHGLANLGLKAALAGSVAKDEDGELFVKDLENMTIKNCIAYKKGNTGVAVNLVTPDGERTFIVNYGIADNYKVKDIDQETLAKSKYLHFTGYEFESTNKTIVKIAKLSKEHGTKISFDLGDPNVVLRNKKSLEKFLTQTDLVFANEEEARNFTGETVLEKALEKLSKYCGIAVVKVGKEGSLVMSGNTYYKVKSYEARMVNTIGAGDGFAAGFLYGLCTSKNQDLELCCKIGNFYASRIVEETGARLSYPIRHIDWMIKLIELSKQDRCV